MRILRFLSNPNKWMIVPGHAIRKTISEIFEMAMTALEQAYGRASTVTDFKHRNWVQESKYITRSKGELRVIPKYRPDYRSADTA